MRVLHFGSGNFFGGVETVLLTLAKYRELCAEMHPEFAVCFEGRLSEELKALQVPVHNLGNVRILNPKMVREARKVLKKILANQKYDLAVTHSMWLQAIFGRVIIKANVPLVFWEHNARERTCLAILAKMAKPDLVISVSEFVAANGLYDRSRVEVLYHPLPAVQQEIADHDRSAVRTALKLPPEMVVIVQVSRMQAWKGHRYLIQALTKLSSMPNWICFQVGGAQNREESQYLENLKKQVLKTGLSKRIVFLGECKNIRAMLSASDIFCQPNIQSEGFSMSFLEAASSGLPIVTSNIGSAVESVDANSGILVRPRDSQALANALSKLIIEKPLRHKMGEHSRLRIHELCDPKRQMRKLGKILTSLTQSK